jgi:hypothetical protein
MGSSKARCVNCRSEVVVPDTYASGDHIKCGVCNTQHKVQRGDVLRLVLADLEPVRQAYKDNERRIRDLESEIVRARGSLGLGANGLGVGVAYVIYQIGLKEQPWSTDLLLHGAYAAIGSAVLLEVANYLFLAKRAKISRLSEDISVLRGEGKVLQQRIREAGRR